MIQSGVARQLERLSLEFAGYLTNEYVEMISLLVGLSGDNVNMRTELLMKVRETELAKVDAIERQLGINPRTAEIRKWFREQSK